MSTPSPHHETAIEPQTDPERARNGAPLVSRVVCRQCGAAIRSTRTEPERLRDQFVAIHGHTCPTPGLFS